LSRHPHLNPPSRGRKYRELIFHLRRREYITLFIPLKRRKYIELVFPPRGEGI